jgi:ribonuclease HII
LDWTKQAKSLSIFYYNLPRGPVIGPLVIAAVLINESEEYKLKDLGVKDSKLLTPKKRSELFPKIKKIAKKYKILKIQPQEIDSFLEADHLNLNWLEARKTADLINELKPNKAFIDCPSPNKKAYSDYIKRFLTVNTELIVDHHAESKFLTVAAASILAKFTRDNEIKELEKRYGTIGPGYQSNLVTQQFIKENFDKHPEIFRKSWSTWKNQDNNKKQKKLDEF